MPIIYVAAPEYEAPLLEELVTVNPIEVLPRCYWCEVKAPTCHWAVNVWYDVRRVSIQSIGDAAKILRSAGPYWEAVSTTTHQRRAALIANKLLTIKRKPTAFPPQRTIKHAGAYGLIDNDTLIYSAETTSPYADGSFPIEEDHQGPPSRAYRKLWESFIHLGVWPQPGDKVLELGAAPGAWTWTIANIGTEVHSVDKAPLDPRVDALDLVHHRQVSAFSLDPDTERCDWLLSDIICYPERLKHLIERWLAHGYCQKYIITIKFQGDIDTSLVKHLAAIPYSRLVHLWHNKHELCWIRHPDLPKRNEQVVSWPWLSTQE